MDKGFWKRFLRDRSTLVGVTAVGILFAAALLAPFLANSRPLIWLSPEGGITFPFLRSFFAPDSTEFFIEQLFNYSGVALLLRLLLRRRRRWLAAALILWIVPFAVARQDTDRRNWRETPGWRLPALIPYGPNETGVTAPCAPPDRTHWCGGDNIGRDVASRLIYGARISLATGLLATSIAFAIGLTVGMISGYRGGVCDLLTMRAVEMLICFPSFLLLLILMGIIKDMKFDQSVLIVIGVIGLTGWMGLAQLVRGETLRLREMAYMQSCRVIGCGVWRTYFVNLLPNLMTPVAISFTFSVAGAILAEASLSFLGFGVQPPTPSWGELLRQAFADPVRYRHLALAPGTALFMAVAGFNLIGEGLRRTLPK